MNITFTGCSFIEECDKLKYLTFNQEFSGKKVDNKKVNKISA